MIFGVRPMKSSKYRPMTLGVSDVAREREVRQEIEIFLRALSSYPDRFAREHLSFEQHLFSMAASPEQDSEDRRRN